MISIGPVFSDAWALYRVLFISLWGDLLSAAVVLDHHRHVALSTASSFVTFALEALVYLWALGSERSQTLIDKAAGSVVVRGTRIGVAAMVADMTVAQPAGPRPSFPPPPPPQTNPPPPLKTAPGSLGSENTAAASVALIGALFDTVKVVYGTGRAAPWSGGSTSVIGTFALNSTNELPSGVVCVAT